MTFTPQELEELRKVLVEMSIQMDDDGNRGAFARSPLKPIYDKIRAALKK